MIRYIISTDGTMIKDLQENKVIYQNDIKKEMVKKLIGYSKQFDTAFYLITESNMYKDNRLNQHQKEIDEWYINGEFYGIKNNLEKVDFNKLNLNNEKVKSLKNGIYEKVNDNMFSKGEKQLLAFARAIAKETSIYIFDEPTSNIDVESEVQLKKVIDNLSSDSTVIIIAHRLETIKFADKILKVENGNVFQIDKNTIN